MVAFDWPSSEMEKVSRSTRTNPPTKRSAGRTARALCSGERPLSPLRVTRVTSRFTSNSGVFFVDSNLIQRCPGLLITGLRNVTRHDACAGVVRGRDSARLTHEDDAGHQANDIVTVAAADYGTSA